MTLWDGGTDRVRGFGYGSTRRPKRSKDGARSRSFINYRIDGREARYTIGATRLGRSPPRARKRRNCASASTTARTPPRDKRARREAPTVQDLIDRYIADHLPNLTEREQVAHRTMLAEIGRHLGTDRLVTAIHHGDLQAMHNKITKSGRPVRANRILGVASKMFSLSLLPLAGEDAPWRDNGHGQSMPRASSATTRKAASDSFAPAELAAISDALAAYPGQTAADCVRLVMLTGCRPGEAMAAKWSEFDAEPGYWVKPSAHTKQRKVHRVPLTPAALELIGRRRQACASANGCFRQNVRTSRSRRCGTFGNTRATHAKLGKAARIYDLRHTFAIGRRRWRAVPANHRSPARSHVEPDDRTLCASC